MGAMSQSVEEFLTAASSWLTDEDSPAVASLRLMAAQLDTKFSAPTASAFGLVYRNLLKRKPGGSAEVDPLEALLRAADSNESQRLMTTPDD